MSNSNTSRSSSSSSAFWKDLHVRYFASGLQAPLPGAYCKLDTNRLTLVHFSVHALDVLGVWDNDDNDNDTNHHHPRLNRQEIMDWICSELQLEETGGFQGGTYLNGTDNDTLKVPHIAMTYCALCILQALGDNDNEELERRINKEGILRHVKCLQQPDGSFQSTPLDGEHDMRFLYCACAISYILGDWSAVDQTKAVEYIQSCRSWDGSIALLPGQEGHGGSTFCAVAALSLMNRLDVILEQDDWKDELTYWCVHRQVEGMQGRPGKAQDTCYSYWIGGTLKLIRQTQSQDNDDDHDDDDDTTLLNQPALREFILKCQSRQMGGFSKTIGVFPDLLHAFYSLAWLSLSNPTTTTTTTGEKDNSDNGKQNNNDALEEAFDIHLLNCTLGIRQARAERLMGPKKNHVLL